MSGRVTGSMATTVPPARCVNCADRAMQRGQRVVFNRTRQSRSYPASVRQTLRTKMVKPRVFRLILGTLSDEERLRVTFGRICQHTQGARRGADLLQSHLHPRWERGIGFKGGCGRGKRDACLLQFPRHQFGARARPQPAGAQDLICSASASRDQTACRRSGEFATRLVPSSVSRRLAAYCSIGIFSRRARSR